MELKAKAVRANEVSSRTFIISGKLQLFFKTAGQPGL
jgi:hypothetical protein